MFTNPHGVRSFVAASLTLLCALNAPAHAMCVAPAIIRSTVNIVGCAPIKLEASQLETSDFGPRSTRLYADGATYSGTLLRVRVLRSSVVDNPFDLPESEVVWPTHQFRSVFVERPASEICKTDKTQFEVQNEYICCDMLAAEGRCLGKSLGLELVTIKPEA
jgi:hypothetical protein